MNEKPNHLHLVPSFVEEVEVPEEKHFDCPHCGKDCVMFPKAKPIGVQHSLPTCRQWKLIEGKKDDVERFLIKAGVHLLVHQGKA